MAIACGTDFSEHAGAAVSAATALARRLGERLILVHALDERALDDTAHRMHAVGGKLSEQLEAAARTIRQQHSLDVETVLVSGGTTEETIVEWIKRGQVQFIRRGAEWEPPRFMVVSALGYRDESRWMGALGSRRPSQDRSLNGCSPRAGDRSS